MDLRLEAARIEQEAELKIRLVQIPREIMEKNRTNPPPFFKIATLEAEAVYHTNPKRDSERNRITPTRSVSEWNRITLARSASEGNKPSTSNSPNSSPSLTEVPTKELEALGGTGHQKRLRLHRLLGRRFRFSQRRPLQPPLARLPHSQRPLARHRLRPAIHLSQARTLHRLRQGRRSLRLRHLDYGGDRREVKGPEGR